VTKKKESERVEDYRGVMLMPTLYKVYAGVLGERLREEIDRKGIIPPKKQDLGRIWTQWTTYMC